MTKTLAILGLICFNVAAMADNCPNPIHHLVVIWLKSDVNDGINLYSGAIEPLKQLEGVLSYSVALKATSIEHSNHSAIDNSYDLIINSTFCNEEALDAFNKHPVYLEIALKQLRPLVDHYKVYDYLDISNER